MERKIKLRVFRNNSPAFQALNPPCFLQVRGSPASSQLPGSPRWQPVHFPEHGLHLPLSLVTPLRPATFHDKKRI